MSATRVSAAPRRTAVRCEPAGRRRFPIVCGVGLNFNRLTRFKSDTSPAWMRDRFGKLAAIVKPGAFDAALRQVRQGKKEIRLLAEHDDDFELISTADRSFKVWADGDALYWHLNPQTVRGRMASLLIAGNSLRQCSIGYSGFTPDEEFNGSFWRTSEVELLEISVVAAGANPGTRIELIY